MANWIEAAKSGRAKCRQCKQAIGKGDLRLGHEFESQFGESTYWYHLKCAADAKPVELQEAMDSFTDDIPDKADLEKALKGAKKHVKATVFPYAERAPSGRSSCISCKDKIPKEELRVAVEEEIDTGSFVTKGARYLHAKCASDYTGEDKLLDLLKAHSTTLEDKDIAELAKLL